MSTAKKNHILHTLSVIGCCRRSKPSAVFSPKPRRPNPRSTSWDTITATTFSSSSSSTPPPCYSNDTWSTKAVQGFGRIDCEGVAVEKNSEDPYQDFRRSMLQMILERKIYSRDDLKELLNCFLKLNSPYYHGIIVRAFTEIWNGVYSYGVQSSSDSRTVHGYGFSGDY